jgi:hypothetical protein
MDIRFVIQYESLFLKNENVAAWIYYKTPLVKNLRTWKLGFVVLME